MPQITRTLTYSGSQAKAQTASFGSTIPILRTNTPQDSETASATPRGPQSGLPHYPYPSQSLRLGAVEIRSSLLENWIDEAEGRCWFLLEATRPANCDE